jgi:hypothetical protein
MAVATAGGEAAARRVAAALLADALAIPGERPIT